MPSTALELLEEYSQRDAEFTMRWMELSRNLQELELFMVGSSLWSNEMQPTLTEPIPEVKWEKCEVREGYELINGRLERK